MEEESVHGERLDRLLSLIDEADDMAYKTDVDLDLTDSRATMVTLTVGIFGEDHSLSDDGDDE